VLNAGKNIILWSGSCGAGEWQSWVYVKNSAVPESNVSKFTSYPDCGSAAINADAYANKMVRFYEDRTRPDGLVWRRLRQDNDGEYSRDAEVRREPAGL
jgi:hypothetical protein